MGCICSKGTFVHEYAGNCVTNKGSKKSSKQAVASSRGKEVVIDVGNSGNVSTAKNLVSASLALDDWEKKAMATAKQNASSNADVTQEGTREEKHISRVFSVSNGVDGAQVAAGWPLWLTSVAGEAIQGWVPRKADSFEKLEKVQFQNSFCLDQQRLLVLSSLHVVVSLINSSYMLLVIFGDVRQKRCSRLT